MKDRIILHCDLNNFFASVSLLERPELKETPVAVCGSVEARHGIVLAKNEAAKKYGVKTAEAVWEAKKKCPDLVILPPDYEKYHAFSLAAREIYARYTDLIEPFGIDECWLDVTGSTLLFGSGEEIADKIRNDIKRELGVTISVGVSFNKVFAKLGSDMKKPDAITVISRENFKKKVWPLPAGDLLFIGKHTVEKLNGSGVFTVGDLSLCDDDMLRRLFGKNGLLLKKYALGLDDSPVCPPDENYKPKSVGRSTTPDHDITDRGEVWRIYLKLAEQISDELRQTGLYATGVQIHTRDTSLNIKEVARATAVPVNSALLIAKYGMELFDKTYRWNLPLRSVGIRAINLKGDNVAVQEDLFGLSLKDEKIEKVEDSLFDLRNRFGKSSIKRGRTIF
ncbi:MAG: DNA polymerase IV [Clostridia bacterium]|nr:DNA polymerase IV [Clostridia bacterium]